MNPDGTTATQVSPVTENEMSSIRSIFDRAANAIVQASELAIKVDELVKVVDGLKNEIEYVRSRNRELDQILADVRNQRDTAMRERDEARSEVSFLKSDLNKLQSEFDHTKAELETTQQAHAHTISDSVQAYDAWRKAEGRAEEAEAKLAEIKKALGIVDPPKPEPVQVPITEHHSEPSPQHEWDHPNPSNPTTF